MKKNIAYIWLLLLGIISFPACKKAGLMEYQARNNIYFSPSPSRLYSGVKDKDGLFTYTSFSNTAIDTAAMDTLYANFGFFDDQSQELNILMTVSAMGDTVGHDRPFKLSVVGSSTLPANEYTIKPEDCVMPHGKVSISVPITVHRDEILRKKYLFLTVLLESNDAFSTDYFHTLVRTGPDKYKTTLMRTFAVADNLPQPSWWQGSNSIGYYCFGAFSLTKMKMLITDLEIPLPSLLENQPPLSYIFGLAVVYNCHLAKARKANHPVMDLDDDTGEVFEMESSDGGGSACE
ncbi:DUF4843 domain-containing protein [Chitinophaga sp.]|uniref:DUF4843 domain-containing protein n=1 Tax=Chitinophaga sp. TaxID=1869181 RepID=UPI002F9409BB